MISYTDDEKYRNFQSLLSTIDYIQTKKRITEDWMETHKQNIMLYREYFGDFNKVNIDCKDRKFRKLAEDTEVLLNHLVWEIQETGYFTVEMYLKLIIGFKQMTEIMVATDDLCSMFGEMSM
jgi:hypothetical protein